ncbi:MAG: hypothetical protein C0618_06485 [Desulfuromonas sp.]|nr:MAG: hypothetical protein C0618_06485 [Desulfuromonas sp.]
MTELDKALVALREKPNSQPLQSAFYDLFLNTVFFVPTVNEMISTEEGKEAEKTEVPMIIESEETDYLVFFDGHDRLKGWAEDQAPCVQLPGHLLAEMSTDGLFWAMNVGTDYVKQFAPDEIAWLKDVVAQCKAAAEKAEK